MSISSHEKQTRHRAQPVRPTVPVDFKRKGASSNGIRTGTS